MLSLPNQLIPGIGRNSTRTGIGNIAGRTDFPVYLISLYRDSSIRRPGKGNRIASGDQERHFRCGSKDFNVHIPDIHQGCFRMIVLRLKNCGIILFSYMVAVGIPFKSGAAVTWSGG